MRKKVLFLGTLLTMALMLYACWWACLFRLRSRQYNLKSWFAEGTAWSLNTLILSALCKGKHHYHLNLKRFLGKLKISGELLNAECSNDELVSA